MSRSAPVGVSTLLRCLPVAKIVLSLHVILFRDLVLLNERHVLEATASREGMRVKICNVDRPSIAGREVAELELVIDHVRYDLRSCAIHRQMDGRSISMGQGVSPVRKQKVWKGVSKGVSKGGPAHSRPTV